MINYPESNHPYASNSDITWDWQGPARFFGMNVTFDPQTSLATGDVLYVQSEGNVDIPGSPFTLQQLANKIVEVPGNLLLIRLVTQPGNKDWGFAVTEIVGLLGSLNFMTYHL